MRSIEKMRSEFSGKLYVFFKDQETGERFLRDAEKEGYLFGKSKPTDKEWADMIAVEKDKTLSYVGAVGRMAYQAGQAVGINYNKYIAGESDYFCRRK